MEIKLTEEKMPYSSCYGARHGMVKGPQGILFSNLSEDMADQISVTLNTACMLGLADSSLKVEKK